MKKLNKSSILSLLCAVVMILSLCMIPGVKSEAAAKAPSIDKSILIFRNTYYRDLKIKNSKKGDLVKNVITKDYHIISAYGFEELNDAIWVSTMDTSKVGTTKVLFDVIRGKKTYKLSMKVKVVPYVCPMKSAKIGKTNVKKSITNSNAALLKKNCSGKLSIKMKKGWTITKMYQVVNGKSVKLKNNKKVNTKKGRIYITVKNKNANQIENLSLSADDQ